MTTTNQRQYCGDSLNGCGASLSETDLELGYCTQCGWAIAPESLPLEHQLLLSLREIQSRRDEDAA